MLLSLYLPMLQYVCLRICYSLLQRRAPFKEVGEELLVEDFRKQQANQETSEVPQVTTH